MSDEQLTLILSGRDAPCDPSLRGDVLLTREGFCIGRALAKAGMTASGVLKNNLPRWMVR